MHHVSSKNQSSQLSTRLYPFPPSKHKRCTLSFPVYFCVFTKAVIQFLCYVVTLYVRFLPRLLLLLDSHILGPDSLVGIATRYGPKCRGSNPGGRGEIFHTSPNRRWVPPSLLYKGHRVCFPGVKRPGCGVDRPPHLSLRLKKE